MVPGVFLNSDILAEAWRVLEAQGKVAVGQYAVSENGAYADPTSPSAKCFCAQGAIVAAKGEWQGSGIAMHILNDATQEVTKGRYLGAATLNDREGLDGLRPVFKRAIEMAKAEEASRNAATLTQ